MLEDNVDEKYYLSDKMIQGMLNTNYESYKLENKLLDKNGVVNTILTRYEGSPQCIQVKNATKKGYLEATDGDGIDISSRMEHHRGTVQKGKTQTLTTSGGNDRGVVNSDLRIRKLTPRECFRLMGVKDEDFDKVRKNQSDASLYHLAGDSIVVNVLMAIFKELL
jgi:DNA (cytosine-5)-methyltransferase 1